MDRVGSRGIAWDRVDRVDRVGSRGIAWDRVRLCNLIAYGSVICRSLHIPGDGSLGSRGVYCGNVELPTERYQIRPQPEFKGGGAESA